MTEPCEKNILPEAVPPQPACFGDGEKVCPRDEDGVMQPRRECVTCPHIRPCLQLALHRRGTIRLVEEPASLKVTGFLRRWSEQKLSRHEKP
ncbi:MAG: hypothetical protein ABFD97_20905 [Syntrophobacter sp.]